MNWSSAARKFLIFPVLFFFVLTLITFAAMGKEIETTASGLGSDENAALADALARAVAQVNGVRSSMNVSTGKLEVTGSASLTNKDGTSTASSKTQVGTTADARMQAQGNISRYEVTNTENLDDGRVRVTVRAYITRYEAPVYKPSGSSTTKKRVAVLPVDADDYRYDFFDMIDADRLSEELATQIEASIMETGRVSLLDRRSLSASLLELGLVGSSFTNANEKAKLRQIRGADLIVMAVVLKAHHQMHAYRVKSTGQTKTSIETNFNVEVRAVVPATGELLVTKRLSVNDAYSRDDALRQMSEIVAYEVVRALTGSAPPIRRRDPVPAVDHPAASDTPRRSGIRLPNDP